MRFFSDNAAPVHAAVLDALARANRVDAAYDGDALSLSLDNAFSDLFETEVAALWIATGTAANAVALASLCPPWRGIVCHQDAHIENDEAGAPEFYTHGAKLMTAGRVGTKLSPADILAVVDRIPADVHRVQPAAISITNATEYGLTYTPDEIAALGALARAKGLGLHMDGARLANAIVHSGCSPAEMTWRGGVDILSFGFVKNGGMSAEALIFFRPELAAEARIRRKRAGHLMSKGRYMAAQIHAMLADDLWRANARAANAGAQRLAKAAGARLLYPVEANELFLTINPAEATALRANGFDFYDWAPGVIRLVISWSQPDQEIAALAAAIAAL